MKTSSKTMMRLQTEIAMRTVIKHKSSMCIIELTSVHKFNIRNRYDKMQ